VLHDNGKVFVINHEKRHYHIKGVNVGKSGFLKIKFPLVQYFQVQKIAYAPKTGEFAKFPLQGSHTRDLRAK